MEIREEIKVELGRRMAAERIHEKEPMNRHTTFRTGGPADLLLEPTPEELPEVVNYCKKQQIPLTVIGNGSNLLVSDAGIDGVVLEIGKQMSGIEIDGELIRVQAGALLSAVAAKAAAQSLTGMEFASGIPGSIGGAVVMNAGAYGGEMKDILVDVQVLTEEREICTLPLECLDLSYRHSALMERGDIVLAATLRLKKGDPEAIRAYMDELKEKRISKQPLEYPSAGSTFKRPEGYFAAKLIEDAGLKGFSVGGAQVSEKHSGFVINRDHATAEDIRALMTQVQQCVMEKFGVALEPEVRMLGRFPTDK